jgi:hypothetical protein
MFFNDSFITANDIKSYVNKLVDKKMSEVKVRIPQEQINDAVVKFFTEKKWFLTEDGKKLDTYDLIRKFAMNTIGVADKGELNPEMLKIVQQEVANIIAKEGLKNIDQVENKSNNNLDPFQYQTTFTKTASNELNDDIPDDFEECTEGCTEDESFEYGYNQGWIDHVNIAAAYLNSYFGEYGIKAKAFVDEKNQELAIENVDGTVFSMFDDEDDVNFDSECTCDKGNAEKNETKTENLSNDDISKIMTEVTEQLLNKKLSKDEQNVLKTSIEMLDKIFKNKK